MNFSYKNVEAMRKYKILQNKNSNLKTFTSPANEFEFFLVNDMQTLPPTLTNEPFSFFGPKSCGMF